MKLDYDNARTRSVGHVEGAEDVEQKTPYELFADFYALQNNAPMDGEQEAYVRDLIEKTWEEAER
jgi:exonuclease SbcD